MNSIKAIPNTDGAVDLIGKQGTTWELLLTFKNPDGSSMNIGGFEFRGQFKPSYSAQEKNDFTISIVDAAEGKILLSVPADASASVAAYRDSIDQSRLLTYKGQGVYVYDIEMINNGKVSRVIEGKLYVDPEATK